MKQSTRTDNTPLYSSRIIDTYIRFIKRNYSYINVNDLLHYAGMEPYQVSDEGHWFTQKQINKFHENLTVLTNNKDIARDVGRYAASSEALGLMRHYLLGLVSPARVYAIIGKAGSKFTKASSYQSKKTGRNKIELTVSLNKGVKEEPFQCENRFGWIEALGKMFNYKMKEIKHPECLFKGGQVCRYIISWHESSYALWKKIRNYSVLLSFLACLVFAFINPLITLKFLLPLSVLIIIVLDHIANTHETDELKSAVDHLEHSSENLAEQVNINYNNALMINEIGQALSRQSNIDAVLRRVVQILKKRLDFDRGMVLLASQDSTRLDFSAGFGYSKKNLHFFKSTSFHLDRKESKGVFVLSFRQQKPFLINDIDEIQDNLTPHSLEFAKTIGVRSFICCPITYKQSSLGILAVDNIKTKRPLLQSDLNLLMGIAPQIGISINNATLREAEATQFKSILQVLAASIDARDPLTAGHSEKVTEYAVGICREMSLSNDYCEMVRVASLLHDYGKIGVDDSILKKNGKLEPDEQEKIRTHVSKTENILGQIHFEGIYKQVPEIAGSHHERIDGSGYPKGLKGDEIPLGAQVIAVADFFEAITSKRHYRDPMDLSTAFKLMRDNIGVYFREEVVEALINYYNKRYRSRHMQLKL